MDPMKAIVMLSGGLDSVLALRLIVEQGVRAHALHFTTAFAAEGPERALKAAREAGVPLTVQDVTEGLLALVHSAPHGRGSGMNPCIDCRIMQLSRARELMPGLGARFVVTGEVLGERPMSQRRGAMEEIERKSGLPGLIVRPLCALALEPSIPEREGWVDRSRFKNITGRRRTPQIALAAELGVTDYPQPAGGCRLTEPNFARRIKDLVEHGGARMEDIALLCLGRHFRLSPGARLVVGRDEAENGRLEALASGGDLLLQGADVAGPTALLRGEPDEEVLRLAARITARYGKGRSEPRVRVLVSGGRNAELTVAPAEDAAIAPLRL